MQAKFGNIEVLRASCNIETVQDGRGAIFTWVPSEPIVEFNLIYFQPNKVRGNHFHPEFVEYFLIVDGSVLVVTEDPETGKEINMHAGRGCCFRIPPNTPHAVHAIVQSLCVAMLTKQWDDCGLPIIRKDVMDFPEDNFRK
ncbi:MAG: cupin domain-containing protein [bacterium]|jgi:mannose-6-phosphate isomerase-like protein (cupin superfamily)|nr:cupin domain-containing protein [bacterium]